MDDAEAYYRRGIVLSVIKNYQDAIPHYDRAIQLRPNFAGAFYNKVSCLFTLFLELKFICS
jgi:tetratricopeptide (TPR) repeat protein